MTANARWTPRSAAFGRRDSTRGGAMPETSDLGLDGYPGGAAIVGNRVGDQFQLDIFGEILLLLAAAARHDHLDADGWRAAELAAGAVLARWREPDADIWDLEPPCAWTHSRLICAAGLRAISVGASARRRGRWLAAADRIVAATSRQALHSSERRQRAPYDARVDVVLLLAGLRGAVRADDPRSIETRATVERDLSDDLYCDRYRPDERCLARIVQ